MSWWIWVLDRVSALLAVEFRVDDLHIGFFAVGAFVGRDPRRLSAWTFRCGLSSSSSRSVSIVAFSLRPPDPRQEVEARLKKKVSTRWSGSRP